MPRRTNMAKQCSFIGKFNRRYVKRPCELVRVLINQRISLTTLSSAPKRAYKCLEYILNQYKDEHSQHHLFDVRRLPLPRLFTILPKPSVHLNHSGIYIMIWMLLQHIVRSRSSVTALSLISLYHQHLCLTQNCENSRNTLAAEGATGSSLTHHFL